MGTDPVIVTSIKGAKNQRLTQVTSHPGILDAVGQPRDSFTGEVYVRTQDWNFYLGDTIRQPIEDKVGRWHLWLELQGERIAEKAFDAA